jgi:predicted metalloenzyme YecM
MNHEAFLNSFFEEIAKSKIDIAGLPLDHIAYQASSSTDYENLIPEFSNLGKFVSEEIVGDRRVAVFRLNTPIQYKNYQIPAVELIESKKGQVCTSAFQHAEFVISQSFQYYIDKYPSTKWDTSSMYRDEFSHLKLNFDNGLTLKFLLKPILELVNNNK